MAAGVDVMIAFIFTGEEREMDEDGNWDYIIPQNATHVSMHESVTVISEDLFSQHLNIVELICHLGVIRIEDEAFYDCPGLERVIIPGVQEVEGGAFWGCESVTDIECDNLERIGDGAFAMCESLSSINLPSIRVVETQALCKCYELTEANFGKKLESIGDSTFYGCHSLERITIPLKQALFPHDDTFQGCTNLRHIDLADIVPLNQTINALNLEEWRRDINVAIDSINHILPNADPGYTDENGGGRAGEKTVAIREWIARVLGKIAQHKSAHKSILNEAAATLSDVFPNDTVMNNIIPFLELPPHEFEDGCHE